MNKIRLDKFLWMARIYKTRSLSIDACKKKKKSSATFWPLFGWWLLPNFENPCQILQDWHKNMIRSVQPNNHWNRKMYTYTLIDWCTDPIMFLCQSWTIWQGFCKFSNHHHQKSGQKVVKTKKCKKKNDW